MWVERCQERSFVRKMYLKKCLQSIGLCVHCCSSQFVGYLFHRHQLMVLSDDGLVQVAWIQTYPYVPIWLPRECHWRDPRCWLNLLRDDFLFYQVIQFPVYCFFGLDWHLPPGMRRWLDWRVYPDVVGSFQAAKSVEWVGVKFLQILHSLAWHCPWFMVDWCFPAAWQFAFVVGLVHEFGVL